MNIIDEVFSCFVLYISLLACLVDCGKSFVSLQRQQKTIFLLLWVKFTQVQFCTDYAAIGSYIQIERFVTSGMLLINMADENIRIFVIRQIWESVIKPFHLIHFT